MVAATPTYVRQQRAKVMGQNLRPVRHPYFIEYALLQKISLQILRHERMSHGMGRNELAGVVFDGSWLWEEYLNKVMSKAPGLGVGGELVHPRNKAKEKPLHIYKPSRHPIYPDFLWRSTSEDKKEQKWEIVLDAKYKKVIAEDDGGKTHFSIARDDRFQMISYMHLTEAVLGVIVCPMTKKESEKVRDDLKSEFKDQTDNCYVEGHLLGHGGSIAVVPFVVPAVKEDFKQYCEAMEGAETIFIKAIQEKLGKTTS